jgi:hypothetical protein
MEVILCNKMQSITNQQKGQALHLSIYENELLSLVMTVQKWRPYLLGRSFKVKTDQQALNS